MQKLTPNYYSPLDSKLLPLKEFQQLESEFVEKIDLKRFTNDLKWFIRQSVWGKNSSKQDFNPADLTMIDKFTENYFDNIVSELTKTIIRAGVIGYLFADADSKGNITPKININDLPVMTKEFAEKYHPDGSVIRALSYIETESATFLQGATSQTKQRVRESLFDSFAKNHNEHDMFMNLLHKLSDDESELNRDWKRVGAYEIRSAMSNGYLSRIDNFKFVVGQSMPDACEHCKSEINGKVLLISKNPLKDYRFLSPNSSEYKTLAFLWENVVWPGKNNIGRSTSEKKRTDDGLTERLHHEKSMPTIPYHVHCACRWFYFNPEISFVNEVQEVKSKHEDSEGHKSWEKHHYDQMNPIIKKLKSGAFYA